MGDVRASKHDPAGRRLDQAHDAVGNGRLPAPRLPDEPEHLTPRNAERDTLDGVHHALAREQLPPTVEALDEIDDLERRQALGAVHATPG